MSWVLHAINHHQVTELDIDFFPFRESRVDYLIRTEDPMFDFPFCALQNSEVRVLKISRCYLEWTRKISRLKFDSIRAIFLDQSYLQDSMVKVLLNTCSNLESLSLRYVWGMKNCKIFGSKITTLSFKNFNGGGGRGFQSIEIDCPNLRSLEIDSYEVKKYSLNNSSALVEATVWFEHQLNCIGHWSKVVRLLGHVEKLTVQNWTSYLARMKGSPLGVRKGAWTKEEDVLLKSCVQKYGEGKWHLVPLKAGLNRCRKSCRLRWFNYLRPNIKRGEFSFDEVDLIIRLHKLLGNRWTLISGRIPGRTANDVKNYWTTKLCKKMISQSEEVTKKYETPKKSSESTIIKPQPRTFSKDSLLFFSGNSSLVNVQAHNKSVESQNNPSKPSPPSLVLPQEDNNAIEPWLESLFAENKTGTPPINWPEDEHIFGSLWGEEVFCVEDRQSFWNCE